jgi:hypothetical protein
MRRRKHIGNFVQYLRQIKKNAVKFGAVKKALYFCP